MVCPQLDQAPNDIPAPGVLFLMEKKLPLSSIFSIKNSPRGHTIGTGNTQVDRLPVWVKMMETHIVY